MEQVIDQAFATMIGTYRIHHKLGINRQHVKTLRHQVKKGVHISMDKKFKLLRLSGWSPGDIKYNDQDLLDLVEFVLKTGTGAKQLGAGYILDKWKIGK